MGILHRAKGEPGDKRATLQNLSILSQAGVQYARIQKERAREAGDGLAQGKRCRLEPMTN